MAMSETSVTQAVQFGDVLCFGLAAAVVYAIHPGGGPAVPWNYCAATAIAVALTASFFFRAGLYDFETIASWPRRMGYLFVLMAVVFALMIALGFALKVSDNFSRLWAFSTFLSATAGMLITRGVVMMLLRRWGRSGTMRRRLAIYGSGPQAEKFIRRVSRAKAYWQEIAGVYDDRRTRAPDRVAEQPVVGGSTELTAAVRRGEVDSVVVALPWNADQRLGALIEHLRELPVHIYLGSDLVGYALPAHQTAMLSNVSVIKVTSAPLSGWGKILKGIEDRVVGFILLVALAPLMLAIAVAIKLDSPGPVLFRQDRYGFNNKLILVPKFRSMYHDRPPEEGVPQATRNDPRVTRIGRLLRRTSLDELPQLFCVLDGSMSLVGPRPHAVEHNEKYEAVIAKYSARHNVKPGMTGWAQVNGLRGETETIEKMRERVRFDIYYVENWSVWFDLRIIFRTLRVIWGQSTAY